MRPAQGGQVKVKLILNLRTQAEKKYFLCPPGRGSQTTRYIEKREVKAFMEGCDAVLSLLKILEDELEYIKEGSKFVDSTNSAIRTLSGMQIKKSCEKALEILRGDGINKQQGEG